MTKYAKLLLRLLISLAFCQISNAIQANICVQQDLMTQCTPFFLQICLKWFSNLFLYSEGCSCSEWSWSWGGPKSFLLTLPHLWHPIWQPTPALLTGKSHRRRSLVGCIHGVAKSRTRLSDFTFTFHFHALEKEMATHSSVLAWRIPEMGEPGGLPSMGSHRVRHDWSDLAVA